jgi:hypothetical protein
MEVKTMTKSEYLRRLYAPGVLERGLRLLAQPDPLLTALEARVDSLQARIATAHGEHEIDEISADVDACKSLLQKLKGAGK